MPALPFPVYDADHHLYEPEEAFTRYLPEQFKREFYFVDLEGRRKLVIGGVAMFLVLMGLYSFTWRRRKSGPVNQAIFDRQVKSQ